MPHERSVAPVVLHVSQSGEGGLMRYVSDLVLDQRGRGWQVVLATSDGCSLARTVAAAGCEVIPWEAARSVNRGLRATRRLGQIVASVRPDLVHLHSSIAGLAGRLAIRERHPTIFQPHGWSFEALEGPLGWGAARWEVFAARWAHAIVCVSNGERDRAPARLHDAVHVIPSGVDPAAYPRVGAPERQRARGGLGLNDAPRVVCVGRLARQKGQDVLLNAWPVVRERLPHAELVLVGDGDDREALNRSAGPGVTFAGSRDDISAWLAAADVVAIPSRWEGMSLVLLEAMSSGCSIVATDVPGAREALAGNGAVVKPGVSDALAEAIAERLLDPARRAAEGLAVATRARREYDLRTTHRRMAELYEQVLSEL